MSSAAMLSSDTIVKVTDSSVCMNDLDEKAEVRGVHSPGGTCTREASKWMPHTALQRYKGYSVYADQLTVCIGSGGASTSFGAGGAAASALPFLALSGP